MTAEDLGLSPHILALPAEQGPRAGHRARPAPASRRRSARWSTTSTATARDHIITIEDPIEFVHENKKCLINQREVAHAHRRVQGRAARRAARGSGHRPRRRDARPRDRRDRDRDRRDRPPRLRHAAHDDGGIDGRSHHRSVPGRSAGADPHHAVGVAARASSRRRCARRSAAAASRRSRC